MTAIDQGVSLAPLLAHLVGDYVVQSDEMASRKRASSCWAAYHAVTYALPFLAVTRSPLALGWIVLTHFAIDRWGLARFVCWAKNFVFSGWTWVEARALAGWVLSGSLLQRRSLPEAVWSTYRRPWSECTRTGYPDAREPWMAVWLLIVADNALHLVLNALALRVSP